MKRSPIGIAALAGAAMLLAHWIAYLIAVPGSHSRAHILAVTGHGYWIYAAAAGLALGTFGVGSFLRSRLGSEGATNSFEFAASRLAAMQVVGFVTLEMAERGLSGHGWFDVITEPVIAIGVVAQLAVAFIGAALLAGLTRVIAQIQSSRAKKPRVRTTIPHFFLSPAATPSLALLSSGLGLRGPPSDRR